MRRVVVTGLVALLMLVGIGVRTPEASAGPLGAYQEHTSNTGYAFRYGSPGSYTYQKVPGDPNLALSTDPPYETRNWFRFNPPAFTDKNVLDVTLTFKTGAVTCLGPNCVSPIKFFVHVVRLYADPNTATAQEIFDGADQYHGLPYRESPPPSPNPDELVLQENELHTESFRANAVADVQHHEGGWYAIAMRLDRVTSGPNEDPTSGHIVICVASSCSGAAPPDPPQPNIALPYLTVNYEVATVWPQLHNNALKGSFSATTTAPDLPVTVRRAQECGAYCRRSAYSPVAKDGYVYTAFHDNLGIWVRAFEYGSEVPVASAYDFVAPGNGGGIPSLAVNKEMVVLTWHNLAPYLQTEVRAFKPGSLGVPPTLQPLWSWTYPGTHADVGATLYGRFVLVGMRDDWGEGVTLVLLKWRGGPSPSVVWKFGAGGDVLSAPAVYKDTVIVRVYDTSNEKSTLFALPFVDPNGDGWVYGPEVRWTYDLGPAPPSPDQMRSGPAVSGGNVYIGTHDRTIYSIPIDGSPPNWIREIGPGVSPGLEIRSSPAVGTVSSFAGEPLVYFAGMITWPSDRVMLVAVRSSNGDTVYSTEWDGARMGVNSPVLADDKVFLWVGDNGAWVVALSADLTSELYRVQVGSVTAGQDGNGNSLAIADDWVFAGNGYASDEPAPDNYGYLIGWKGS